MTQYCGLACDELFRRQRLQSLERSIAGSFFKVTARDIDEKRRLFLLFQGKLQSLSTWLVNAVSSDGVSDTMATPS
jgi:hypothetical protein